MARDATQAGESIQPPTLSLTVSQICKRSAPGIGVAGNRCQNLCQNLFLRGICVNSSFRQLASNQSERQIAATARSKAGQIKFDPTLRGPASQAECVGRVRRRASTASPKATATSLWDGEFGCVMRRPAGPRFPFKSGRGRRPCCDPEKRVRRREARGPDAAASLLPHRPPQGRGIAARDAES
jgi:hypothetical protein